MLRAADMGGVIFPPVPSFYHVPKTIEGIVDQTVGKILDVFNIEHHLFKRWESEDGRKAMELLEKERKRKGNPKGGEID